MIAHQGKLTLLLVAEFPTTTILPLLESESQGIGTAVTPEVGDHQAARAGGSRSAAAR